ncbi:MFS transporter [Amycolatopsis granulosa]|uniref:MFS transporter n=1 Tax=Amycolatopsis granulosa TaxID=185684 RepID=UPI001423014B|nr:MFS transporter [Amycolatopsis granulosa]NIH83924.1 MFS family permease [Amycolatopsis granulosa]
MHAESPTRAHGAAVLTAACLGLFTVLMQTTQTIGTLSAVQDELHLGPAQVVWIPSVYTLIVATFVLAAGALADRNGRRRVFLAGVAAMAAGGVLLVFAGSFPVVLAGQAIAGLGGALIAPSSLALLAHQFPEPARRAAAISAWAAVSGLGLAVGPIAAGLALKYTTWHAAFWVNPLLAVIAAVTALAFVPESRTAGSGLDLRGLLLGAAGVGALIYTLIEGGHTGPGSGRVITAAAIAVAALGLFVVVELRHRAPMLDLRLMRNAQYSAALVLAAAVLFGFVGVSVLQVLWLQRVAGLSALAVGVQMLAEFGAFIVVSALAGLLVRRVPARWLVVAGLLAAAAGAALFTAIGPDDTFPDYLASFVLFGLGCGLANGPSTVLAVEHVPRGNEGAAAGTVNAARQLGSVLGTSVLGTLMTATLESTLAGLPPAQRPAATAPVFTDAVGTATRAAVLVLLAVCVLTTAVFVLAGRRSRSTAAPAPAAPQAVTPGERGAGA